MEISVNGLKLNYSEEGPKAAPAVIFLHAFPFSGAMWNAQVEALRSTHRVITYDYRGFGQSEQGSTPVSIDLLAEDLIALQDELNLAAPAWCGLSMGGYVALRAKELFPSRVSKLVLADTRMEPDTDEARAKRFQTIKAVMGKGVGLFAEGFVKNVVAPETLTTRPEVLQHLKSLVMANSAVGISQGLMALAARTHTGKALSENPVPILILVGEKDGLTPPAMAQAMQKEAAGSKLIVIPGAGHMANLENPSAFNVALRDFL